MKRRTNKTININSLLRSAAKGATRVFNNVNVIKKHKEKKLRLQKEKEEERLRLLKEKLEEERKRRKAANNSLLLLCFIPLLLFGVLVGSNSIENTSSKILLQETVQTTEQPIKEMVATVDAPTVEITKEVKDKNPELVFFSKGENLQYNTGTVDPLDLVNVSYGDIVWNKEDVDSIITISSDIDMIDTSQIGNHEVIYNVSVNDEENEITKEYNKVFKVEDKYSPKMHFTSNEVNVSNGAYFEPWQNITELADNNNQDFVYVNEEPKEKLDYNWYTVVSDVNTNVAGLYTVKVIAGDSSGNKTTRTYKVNVDEPIVPEPVVQEVYQEVQPQVSYIININTTVFHYPGCHSVSRMKEKNKWYYTGTRDEVIDMGYVPCKNCNP